MTAIIICSDFGAKKRKSSLFPLFPHLFPMKWWDLMPWSSFSGCSDLKTQYSKNWDHGIRSHHFMGNRRGTMETVRDFIFWGSQITAVGDYSHEIKRCLLLGRKATANLDSILKSRDITWPAKVHLVKAMVFPVVMYGCESWTIKKAEHQRIDAFELWC